MEENLNPDPTNMNPEQNPSPKSNKGLFVVIALMAIIIVALLGYVMINNSDDSKESGTNNSTSTSKVSESDKDSKDKEEKDTEEDEDSEKSSKDEEEDEKNTTKDDEEDEDEKNTTKDNEEDEDEKNTTKDDEEDKDEKNTSSSGFGKKDKEKSDDKETTGDEENADKKEDNSSAATVSSSDWKSAEFTLNGKAYKINDDYTKFNADGWYIDLKKAGYEDGYILNKNDKVYSTIDFLNDKYDDADVNVGFINLGEKAKDVTECQVWAITVDNKYSDTPIEFALPGGLKYGSTLAEVEAAYGKPTDEDDIYRSEDLGYTTYTYDNDLEPQLRLTIWDEGGLTKFEYKIY